MRCLNAWQKPWRCRSLWTTRAGITRVVTVPAWLALLKRALERGAKNGAAGASRSSRLRTHVRSALGGDFEHFVSGGAPLAYEVAEFFETVGTPVIQG